MIQALIHARKKLFGPSTEVTQMDGQLSLFESVQELAEQLNLSKEKITVKPYTRTSRQPGVRQEMLAGLPQEVEEYVLPADEKCSVCGGEMKVVGKRVICTEVVSTGGLTPMKLVCEYSDISTEYLLKKYSEFLEGDYEIMFAHIREGSEIDHFKEKVGTTVITLLIRRDDEKTYGNSSDDDVELYQYDYVYDNNYSLKETEGYFLKYLYKILSENRTISPEVQDKNRKNRYG